MLKAVRILATITNMRTIFAVAALGLGGSLSLGPALAAADAQGGPSFAHHISAVCRPPAPGDASCLALRVVADSPLAVPGARALPRADRPPHAGEPQPAPASEQTTPLPDSLAPAALLSAYQLPGAVAPSSPQTIGIVDAYDDPTIEADLQRYDQQYQLPECTAANGCFTKVNQAAQASPLPAVEDSWAQEISTDVEISHAVCQTCRIVLVEAYSEKYEDLEQAEQAAAVALGATEISNSWGGGEHGEDSPAFDHPGIVITASAGDYGYRNWLSEEHGEPGGEFTSYPASSPNVVAVGGTRLLLGPAGEWRGEEVWNDGAEEDGFREAASDGADGGGCSELFEAPAWQRSLPNWPAVGCGERRAVSDVSADADPVTGVAVYDSTEDEGAKGWTMIGGTSVASPIVAATFALAGGAQGVAYPAQSLYLNAAKDPSALHDVTSGSNGECLQPLDFATESSSCSAAEEARSCGGMVICLAGPGYDGPTGLGTPNGIADFEAASEASHEAGRKEGTGSDASATASSTPSPPAPAPIAVPLGRPAVTISDLALTVSALVALNHRRPRISQVGFAFDLNVPRHVRATLAERVRKHRHAHARWKNLQRPLTIAAVAGRNSRRLSGRLVLGKGDYRLTLTPSGGASSSLDFVIG